MGALLKAPNKARVAQQQRVLETARDLQPKEVADVYVFLI